MDRSPILIVELMVLASVATISGCVTRDPYPDYWPALTEVPKSACPNISGRYRNEALHTGQCYGTDYKAQWNCDVRLNWALGEPALAADEQWVEIRQPDPDQIVIVTSTETRVLRRSTGDFDCDDEGVLVSERASIFSEQSASKGVNAYMTTAELLVASGGVNTLKLHFRRAADGSLVAKLSESSDGLVLAIPFHMSALHYLRWGVWMAESTAADSDATRGSDPVRDDAPTTASPPESPPADSPRLPVKLLR
jgi:hypothetical protein